MGKPVIEVRNLGKKYRLGQIGAASLRHEIERFVAQILKPKAKNHNDSNFWALKDVSFDVQPGEIIGIIGRNGAGKSTLLKILSRITDPTEGQATLRGRVASLLEVGTGFHPELTGRENVYLNGTILGMKKRGIDARFDEIVAFAEMERQIDTPVKRYSSGQRVRLAFAVAAHLDSEILIVDEVLAVGDAAFQARCREKLDDNQRNRGNTILFVSHQLPLVRNLCQRGLVLEKGRLNMDNDIESALDHYIGQLKSHSTKTIRNRSDRGGTGRIRITDLTLFSDGWQPADRLPCGNACRILVRLNEPVVGASLVCAFYDEIGALVLDLDSSVKSLNDQCMDTRCAAIECAIPILPLKPGRYHINVALALQHELLDHLEAAASVEIIPGHLHGRPVSDRQRGYLFPEHSWRFYP